MVPTRAETLREPNQQATYPVIVSWVGYTVNNEVTIIVSGLGVVVNGENIWDGVGNTRTYYSPNPTPGVSVSILHVTDHRTGADCPGGSPNTAFRFTGCFEDDVDMDYNDLIYTITYPDTTPPTTTHALTGTAGSNGWYTSNVNVTLTATDNVGGTGVASTSMDGSSYTTARTVSTEGTTTHTYFSVDSIGNTETTKSFNLKIDKTAPSAAITSHTASQPVRGTISFGGTASDATSGLASVEISTDGTTWNSATITGGSWSYSLNTTTLTDGTRAIQVRATDNAGLQTTTSLALLVDNTIPASTFSSAPTANAWYAGSVTLSGTSSDVTSGVASLQRRTDSGSWTSLSGTTTWSFTVDTTTLSD